jgi:hypothetical protein
MDDQGSIPGRGRNFSLRQIVQICSKDHSASYSMGIEGFFGDKAAGKWSFIGLCIVSLVVFQLNFILMTVSRKIVNV